MANFFIKKGKRIFDASTPTSEKVITVSFFVVGIIVTGIIVHRVGKSIRDKITSSKFGSDDATQIAMSMHSALNPVGLWGAGTDESQLYTQAKKMKDRGVEFKKVSNAYSRKYKSDLLSDLESDLSPDEFEKIQFKMGVTKTYQALDESIIKLQKIIGGDYGKTRLSKADYTKLADDLHADLTEWIGTTEYPLYYKLLRSNNTSTYNVNAIYTKKHKRNLVNDIRDKSFSTGDGKFIKTPLLRAIKDRVDVVSNRNNK